MKKHTADCYEAMGEWHCTAECVAKSGLIEDFVLPQVELATQRLTASFERAAAQAVEEHLAAGRSVPVWRNGRIEYIRRP